MTFRLLLWLPGLLMAFASRRHPAFRQHVSDKDLTFELFTLDDKVARHFVVKDLRVSSCSGRASQAAFGLAFKDAASRRPTSNGPSCRVCRAVNCRSKAIRCC